MSDLNLEWIVLEKDNKGNAVVTINDTTIIVNNNDYAITTRPLTHIESMLIEALRISKSKEIPCVPDEPYFVLLGRDPQAPNLIGLWARDRHLMEHSSSKPAYACLIADKMRTFKTTNPNLGMYQSKYDKLILRFQDPLDELFIE